MSKLAVCLIVRDEEKNLARALKSVQGVADEIVVVDTGSTDSTVAIARAAGAKVVSHQWRDDFSEARNFALDQASHDWVLQLDADEELHEADPEHIKKLLSARGIDAYVCQIVNMMNPENLNGAVSHKFPRLFRRSRFRYVGVVHESPEHITGRKRGWPWAGLHIIHWGYMDKEAAPKRSKRNFELITKAIERQPDDFLLYWYLGEHYTAGSRLREALKCYRKADSLRTPGTYTYQALFILRICECLWKLKRLDEAREYVEFGIETFPDYRDLMFLAGHIYETCKDWEKALLCHERCAAMTVVSPDYLMVREGLDRTAAERAGRLRGKLGAPK